jgi:hypothetical protein
MKQILFHPTLMERLRNAEHFDFYENIVIYAESDESQLAEFRFTWNVFRQAFGLEDEIYKRNAKQEETKRLVRINKERRISFMALKRRIELAIYDKDPHVKEAGETLMQVVKNYRFSSRVPQTEASALMHNLVEDLKKAIYAAPVALAGAGPFISRLEADNAAFMSLYAERASNKETYKEEGSLFNARRQVDRAFLDLSQTINAFARTKALQRSGEATAEATLEELIHFVNSYIHRYEDIYARRNPKYHSARHTLPDLFANMPSAG